MSKNLFKGYIKPIKAKNLFKEVNKSSKTISKISISAVKQSENFRLNEKNENKIIEENLKSLKWLRSLFIKE